MEKKNILPFCFSICLLLAGYYFFAERSKEEKIHEVNKAPVSPPTRSVASVQPLQKKDEKKIAKALSSSLELYSQMEKLPHGNLPIKNVKSDPVLSRYKRSPKSVRLGKEKNYSISSTLDKMHYSVDELPLSIKVDVLYKGKPIEADIFAKANQLEEDLMISREKEGYSALVRGNKEYHGPVTVEFSVIPLDGEEAGTEFRVSESFNLAFSSWNYLQVENEDISQTKGITYHILGETDRSSLALCEATLKDNQGRFVGMVEKMIAIKKGKGTIDLNFSSALLKSSESSGPYTLSSLSVSPLSEKYTPMRSKFFTPNYIGKKVGSSYFKPLKNPNPLMKAKADKLRGVLN